MRHAFLLSVALFTAAPLLAAEQLTVEVFKSPLCGCCSKWVDHLRANGFKVVTHDVDDVPAKRQELGMPDVYGSCHTARVQTKAGSYLLEGHVPAREVRRLLAEKPKAKGLAVPGMPAGSPGMEGPHSQSYDVMLVENGGSARVFARY